MLLCCSYRPPSASSVFLAHLTNEFDTASSIGNEITLIGDLNCDLGRAGLTQSKMFLNFLKQFNLTEIVNAPTRVTMSTASFIDVIAATRAHCFEAAVVHPFGASDHHLVTAQFHARCLNPGGLTNVFSFVTIVIWMWIE